MTFVLMHGTEHIKVLNTIDFAIVLLSSFFWSFLFLNVLLCCLKICVGFVVFRFFVVPFILLCVVFMLFYPSCVCSPCFYVFAFHAFVFADSYIGFRWLLFCFVWGLAW